MPLAAPLSDKTDNRCKAFPEKVRFPNRDGAISFIALRKKQGKKKAKRAYVYRCYSCGFYHISSQKRGISDYKSS